MCGCTDRRLCGRRWTAVRQNRDADANSTASELVFRAHGGDGEAVDASVISNDPAANPSSAPRATSSARWRFKASRDQATPTPATNRPRTAGMQGQRRQAEKVANAVCREILSQRSVSDVTATIRPLKVSPPASARAAMHLAVRCVMTAASCQADDEVPHRHAVCAVAKRRRRDTAS